jgi:hypothetical protein
VAVFCIAPPAPYIQLELVLLVSTMASDDKCCQQLASSNIISLLYQLWKEKSEDAEVVLQLIHCFHKLMQNEASREEALYRCVRPLLTPSDPSFLCLHANGRSPRPVIHTTTAFHVSPL